MAELREKISAFISAASVPAGTYNGDCDVCETRGQYEVKAIALCVDCDTELCDPCKDDHNKRFEVDDHHVRPLTNSDACAKHPHKKVTKHCLTCRTLLCPLCVMAPHDPQHTLADISGTAADKRKAIQAEVTEVKRGTMDCGNLRALVKGQQGDVNNIAKAVNMKIDSQRDALKQQIDSETENLKDKVEELRLLGLQQLDVYLQDTEATIASKLSLLSLAEELTTHSTDSELLGKADDLLQLLQEERELKAHDCVLQLPFYTVSTVEQEVSVGGVKPMTRRVSLADGAHGQREMCMTSDPRPGHMSPDHEQENEGRPQRSPAVPVTRPSQQVLRQSQSHPNIATNTSPENRGTATRSPANRNRRSQRTASSAHSSPHTTPQTTPRSTPQPARQSTHQPPHSTAGTPHNNLYLARSRSDSLDIPRRSSVSSSGGGGGSSGGASSPSPSVAATERPAFVLRIQGCIPTDTIKDLKVSARHRRIYVSTRNHRQPIQLYDYSGRRMGHFGTGISSPWGVCHADRYNLISVCDGNAFHLFHQGDLRFYKTVSGANFQNLMFSTFCEDLSLFAFTDTKDKCIHFVDARTFKVARRINLGDARAHILPWSISYINTPRSGVIINDVTSTNKKVYVLDMDGRCQQQFTNPGPYEKWNPIKCCPDSHGNLVVVDSETDRLGRFVEKDQSLWHNLLTGENLRGGRPEHCDLTRDGVLVVGCNSYQGAYVHVFNGYQ